MSGITRDKRNRMIGGVCAGMARHFGWSITGTRVVYNDDWSTGSTGLWVADSSIIPQVTRANTNATAIMIGERVADWVAAGATGLPGLTGPGA